MKRKIYLLVGIVIIFLIAIIAIYLNNQNNNQTINLSTAPEINNENVTSGTEKYQNFILDNTLHSKDYGDIHYNVYIPDSYDGSEPYALYMTLPGYQGLYFQGVGENLKTEEFGFVAPEYNSKMIIVAPQLDDWQELSANQTIELTEYFLSNYNIDSSRVYANGYSGGGETMSIVMGKRPDLLATICIVVLNGMEIIKH
ncbi:MAG: prolyl oligopeptidase family serine peptidase [Thomasclavelia ramosa]